MQIKCDPQLKKSKITKNPVNNIICHEQNSACSKQQDKKNIKIR